MVTFGGGREQIWRALVVDASNVCVFLAKFLARAQHWRALSKAIYVCEGSSFSFISQFRETAQVHAKWNPDLNSLCPAYAISIGAPFNAVVLTIRGSSNIIDMLIDSGARPKDFHGGKVVFIARNVCTLFSCNRLIGMIFLFGNISRMAADSDGSFDVWQADREVILSSFIVH
ncbi:hypothetical protein KP509_23G038300 [Ceratopteris richardii]|uniref:Uncharacterized protein n=1 Tax=Ceratopteris richardii TaxID=49495 RepID=A0A8T2RZ16_CERRI|nr:hypothetical protein KP509_23G038300 [Ceratopteris richardii]